MAPSQPSLSEFTKLYHTWVSTVQAVVRPGRYLWCRPNQRDYRRLHARLLDACRNVPGEADSTQRLTLGRIAHLMEPWGTLDTLQAADRVLLKTVASRATALERGLPRRSAVVPVMLCATCVGIIACSVAIVASRGMINFNWTAYDWLGSLRGETQGWINTLQQATFFQKTVVGTIGFVLIATHMLRRTRVD